VILLAGLFVALARPAPARGKEAEPVGSPMQRVTLTVMGMHCSHCVESVRRALSECVGVSSAEVDLGAGKAVVQGETLDINALLKAVKSLGYEAREAG